MAEIFKKYNVKDLIDKKSIITSCENDGFAQELFKFLFPKVQIGTDPKLGQVTGEVAFNAIKDSYSKFIDYISVFRKPKDTFFYFENQFVDAHYKNMYNNFFINSGIEVGKFTMKIVFFEKKAISNYFIDKDFFEEVGQKKLEKSLIGFLILKPIQSNIIHRAVINPMYLKIYEDSPFYIRTCEVPFSIHGVTLKAKGFPYFAQSKYNSCAESSLLMLVNYHSHRYSLHKELFPSDIHQILKIHKPERTVPTQGFRSSDISTTLKKIGFNPSLINVEGGLRIPVATNKNTSRSNSVKTEAKLNTEHSDKMLRQLACFVESGMPVLIMIEGSLYGNDNQAIEPFRHVAICVGRQKEWKWNQTQNKNISFYESFEENDFIFVDDKIPFYGIAKLKQIGTLYEKADLKGKKLRNATISSFIVPNHKSIWLMPDDLEQAKDDLMTIIRNNLSLQEDGPLKFKYFLSTARNIRNHSNLHFNSSLEVQKVYLLSNLIFAKFLYVIEISNNYNKKIGFAVLDPTAETITKGLLLFFLGKTILNKESIIFGVDFVNEIKNSSCIYYEFYYQEEFLNFEK